MRTSEARHETKSRWSWRSAAALSALVLLSPWLATPAGADWLVTTDGQRVETDGPWKAQGKLVVFKRPNGSLSSIRLSAVDLDASREATAEAVRPAPPPPPPPPPKKPVLVLTDADVGHVTPEGDPLTPEAEGQAPADESVDPARPATTPPGVEVTDWRQVDDPENLNVQILGTVTNKSQDLVTGLSVTVRLLSGDGSLIAEKAASLAPTTLAAGAAVNFRAVFTGVVTFSTAAFEVGGGLRVRPVGVVESPPADAETR